MEIMIFQIMNKIDFYIKINKMETINHTINLPLILGEHNTCNNTIKQLKQENSKLKKKQNDIYNLLGTKDIDEIYNFILKKVNIIIDKDNSIETFKKQIKEKDEIINNISLKMEEWIKKDNYMTDFLNKNGFYTPNELLNFIIKFKNHKCKCNCKYSGVLGFISNEKNMIKNNELKTDNIPIIPKNISTFKILEEDNEMIIKKAINILLPKVDLNNCLYKRFKKEKDDRISKIKNKIILAFKEKIIINRIKLFLKKKEKIQHQI